MAKNIIIIILALALFGAILYAGFNCMESGEVYALTGKVIGIGEQGIVTFETATGIKYQFRGSEDYEIGDCVSVVMYRNHTQTVFDDAVMMVQYSSWNLERWY